MNARTYMLVSGLIFLLVGALHLLRLLWHSTVQFGGTSVPFWASWVGMPVAWGLSLWAFRSRRE